MAPQVCNEEMREQLSRIIPLLPSYELVIKPDCQALGQARLTAKQSQETDNYLCSLVPTSSARSVTSSQFS